MANLEYVDIHTMDMALGDTGEIIWTPNDSCKGLNNVPQIFFEDGIPWTAANEYALYRLRMPKGNLKTVKSNMSHLKAYASWLEEFDLSWLHFPQFKYDRCIFRFRGSLIENRELGLLASSTTTLRMNAVCQFYEWAQDSNFTVEKSIFDSKAVSLNFYTAEGFARKISVYKRELSIPNRKGKVTALEDGLLPITESNRKILLSYLKDNCTEELYLMFLIGFSTGARSETIRTLNRNSIEYAIDDPILQEFKRVSVGPGTGVKTKFDKSGTIAFPKALLKYLEEYASSSRRLSRSKLAVEKNQNLLFLSKYGHPYTENTFTKLVSDLRYSLLQDDFKQFVELKFHQSRATFATQLMTIAMKVLPLKMAMRILRDALLHADERTAFAYVKFIEQSKIEEELSSEFFELFTGLANHAM